MGGTRAIMLADNNGDLFVEHDEGTGTTSDPKPSSEFPTSGELVQHQKFLNARLCALDHLPAALLREAFAGRP